MTHRTKRSMDEADFRGVRRGDRSEGLRVPVLCETRDLDIKWPQ